jgi:hypothetical protein
METYTNEQNSKAWPSITTSKIGDDVFMASQKALWGRPIYFASIENSEISHLACAHKQGGLAEQGKNLN